MTPIIKRMELAEAALVKNGFQCVGGVWAPAPAAPAASADTLQTFDWGRDGMVPTDDPNSAYCYTRDAIAHTAQAVAAERTAKEHAIQQSQQHAMEARTQRGTVLGILRHFDCAEEDWHALELVKVAHENEVQAAIARAAAPQQHAQAALSDATLQSIIEAVGQARNQRLSPVGTLLLVRRSLAASHQPAAAPARWIPTTGNINALPDGIRQYVHDLIARCDPSGDVAATILARDTCDGLQRMYRKAADALAEVEGCFSAAEAEGLQDALAETTDERLKDLVQRRLMYAYAAAQFSSPAQLEVKP